MEDNKMKTEHQHMAYETPCVELMCWADDILANGSTDVGSEYPDDWA